MKNKNRSLGRQHSLSCLGRQLMAFSFHFISSLFLSSHESFNHRNPLNPSVLYAESLGVILLQATDYIAPSTFQAILVQVDYLGTLLHQIEIFFSEPSHLSFPKGRILHRTGG